MLFDIAPSQYLARRGTPLDDRLLFHSSGCLTEALRRLSPDLVLVEAKKKFWDTIVNE